MEQWHYWNKSFYTFVHTKSTWEDAAISCSSMREGAHLVFIESEVENKEVSRLAKVASEGQEELWWIGLTDKETEGVWKWYNITAIYTPWMEYQPDDWNGEDCGLLKEWQDDRALWNDESCSFKVQFICEKDMEA
ncbi:Collectin-12 [Holothuria leucospilota]|uniref:Collectin-12 n=1 Tax=Holothuria leucospilota TaxID=206669 RepID=A0A9Q1HC19_HOLLE|nr:Collectin-12 [Holothuria leucospilota]